jgi:hypothetical protein
MSHLERLGNRISVDFKRDADGFFGRECPVKECLGYFKLTPGTGLKGKDLPCYCAYCGHKAPHNHFWTKEQLAYAKSVAINRITGAVLNDLKAMEFNHRPRGGFGIGISMRVEGQPHPIRYYREKKLETEVVCDRCTLRYAIYGVFGFCPDCGARNSAQILSKNLELFGKILDLASASDPALAELLVGNALEDAVSAFDGFGRETCRRHASKASDPAKVEEMSFQNLTGARDRVRSLFGFDFAAGAASTDWDLAVRCFQKRHLLAHKMGVVDQEYLKATADTGAVVGRKVRIERDEVNQLFVVLKTLSADLIAGLEAKTP